MPPNKRSRDAEDNDAGHHVYPLGWPRSQRWNPAYSVPRNSLDPHGSSELIPSRLEEGIRPFQNFERYDTSSSTLVGRQSTGVRSHGVKDGRDAVRDGGGTAQPAEEEFSNLSHWLETLAELYMNNLDNRARWDPRWLNITRRERFQGLSSASITIVDYLAEDSAPRNEQITSKNQLANTLQSRPENCHVRVILVSDLSRFVMGALGQMFSIEPEFWFEHLVNSGYAASDSQLKVFNAVWMNWAARETRFRHRALPGTGQRTEWNIPRRVKAQDWAHLRWGRLGQMHYLGRKGFHENEVDGRLGDGRWVMERDVVLDWYGRLVTKKREAHMTRAKERREKKAKKERKDAPRRSEDETWSRYKATNVYRAYSTFEGLPVNISQWQNRDLRVMAPEAASYWSGTDAQGRKTVVLLFDPVRNMKHEKTHEMTPSLTFMPRAMEIESYSDEELWRTADVDETFLDPPPPRLSIKEQKKAAKAAKKQQLLEKKERLQHQLKHDFDGSIGSNESILDYSSDSTYTDDSDYDEDYEKELRQDYSDPKPHARDRDFARKNSLPTRDLILRYLNSSSTADMLGDESIIPSILTRLLLDDSWRLMAELRQELDHLDSDFSATLYDQLVELIGNSTRQNVYWIRTTLQELCEWGAHLNASSTILASTKDLVSEIEAFNADLQALRTQAEQTLGLLTASMGLAQSSQVIDQTSGINKLTELAFFFIPISFITSVFSMQVHELLAAPPKMWTWGLTLSLVVLATYLIRITLRSPSVRVAVLHCRATIINRFSSNSAGSASRRLNSVGNRAIVKFLFFFFIVMFLAGVIAMAMVLFIFLIFGGLWLGAVATALYFIITRWPEPAVLIPCFIALPLAVAGMAASIYWVDPLLEWMQDWSEGAMLLVKRMLPEKWTLDNVDDDDLAKEGVNTYARQALVLAT
ncbi:hypothetical protein PT974_01757 [Cladobotryum mycophilum]|uniref:Mg2+ transporter protein, CorA-like/Zinc transport protein ZntB n=1 Tax=Cladobotryum mycophilum TaxID=491253 RepID=A0ABR0SWA6_9HYPO